MSKPSLTVCRHHVLKLKSFRHRQKVNKFCFQHKIGTNIFSREISLNTDVFSSITLPTKCVL
jgi:hypothetical protein